LKEGELEWKFNTFPSNLNDAFKQKPLLELKRPYLNILSLYHLKLKPGAPGWLRWSSICPRLRS